MKIGDQVRFLNETGGGKVAGFQGKNIVLVEDEDGFRIPMTISEVVVTQTDDYSTLRMAREAVDKGGTASAGAFGETGNRSVSAMLRDGQDEEIDMSMPDTVDDDREITFRAKPQEREGGNALSAYLAFVPMASGGEGGPRYAVYFVNDSNYYMRFAYAVGKGEAWMLRAEGEIEPNTKEYIEEITREEVGTLGQVAVQLLAYKRDGAFEIKPTVDASFRIDPVKFHKVHTFRPNPFFEAPSMLFTIVENDKTERPRDIDADELRKSMFKDAREDKSAEHIISNYQREQLIGRYADNQRKGNKNHSPYVRRRDLDDAVVVDLHAEQILDSTKGMNAGDILEYQLKVFRDTLTRLAAKKSQKVIFIHGKGGGVLRRALINELTYKYKSYAYQDASFQEYGYGATMVTIK